MKRSKIVTIAKYFCAIAGVGFLTGCIFMFIDTRDLVETTGTVVDIDWYEKLSYGNKEIWYTPVVEFTTSAGRTVKFKSNDWDQEEKYVVGESIEVLYDPASPNRAKVKSGIWSAIAGLGFAGFVSFLTVFVIHKWMK